MENNLCKGIKHTYMEKWMCYILLLPAKKKMFLNGDEYTIILFTCQQWDKENLQNNLGTKDCNP